MINIDSAWQFKQACLGSVEITLQAGVSTTSPGATPPIHDAFVSFGWLQPNFDTRVDNTHEKRLNWPPYTMRFDIRRTQPPR